MTETRLVDLAIPREAEFVSLARLVVSSVAGDRYELTDDQLDSLKLAVSEACVLAMDGAPSDSVDIACLETAGRLDVCIGRIDDRQDGVGEEPGLPFIGTLVDEIAFEPLEGGGSQLRMTLYCEQAEQL